MRIKNKLFYEAPTLDSVELKLEGVIAASDPVKVSGSTLDNYDSSSIFGDDQYDEDW